jgi:hypothetical protein
MLETPLGIVFFIIIAAVVVLVVYLSRRSARSSGSSSGYGGAPVTPPAGARPRPNPQAQPPERSRQEQSQQSAPPLNDNIPDYLSDEDDVSRQAPSGLPASPPPVQAPVPKPSPRRSAEGLFDEEEIPKPQAPMPPMPAPVTPRSKPSPATELPTTPVPIPAPSKATDTQPMPAAPAPSPITDTQTMPAVPASEPEPDEVNPVATEDVRFTAFHPKEAVVNTWYTMLVYTHIESALSRVQADAVKYKDEMGGVPRESRSGATAQLARGTEITILPEMENVEFNPERITFKWVEDMHRAEFRMKAKSELAGLAGNGAVSIFIGPLIIATIRFGMLFEEHKPVSAAPEIPLKLTTTAPQTSETANIYKAEQIFASYSHKDSPVVLACRDAYKALGYDVLIDIDTLRSGEKWNNALMRMIDRADIFQLFWSPNSAQSEYCRQEWEYALRKAKQTEGFIRPVYWEKPLVSPPNELAELHFAYVPLPKSQ